MTDSPTPASRTKTETRNSVSIDRILARLARYRCKSCGQVCLVPHVRVLAEGAEGRSPCRPQLPLAYGF